ncbi:MAG: acetylmannosamine-6-phosphate 2-epimerase, partial [Cyanobacteriota bacterium]|nr:acetylmannosamine-6-phosphate 2-epimerase [Cyanobacteriota bacterium]
MPLELPSPSGLIVSVQAPEGSPMRDPEVIAAMAEA